MSATVEQEFRAIARPEKIESTPRLSKLGFGFVK
jgi:hypothetical protein